jgi:predicted nucleic acid-binding protein
LVSRYRVSGVRVHDARLVATMHVHRVEHLLTFNTSDFIRYQELVTVVAPADL